MQRSATLDTPANRAAMPKADFSSWTPCEEVAAKVGAWATQEEQVQQGALYAVETKQGKSEFKPVA